MADQTNLGKVYTHFQAKTAKKTTPFGATHAYMPYIRKYSPPPLGGLLVAVPSPRQRKNGGRVWLHVGYPPCWRSVNGYSYTIPELSGIFADS